MKTRIGKSNLLFFAAGLLAASALMFGLFSIQSARADQYSCIRTNLDARGMSGNIPDPAFLITYTIPSCYAAAGYHAEKAYMRSGEVAVKYVKN